VESRTEDEDVSQEAKVVLNRTSFRTMKDDPYPEQHFTPLGSVFYFFLWNEVMILRKEKL